MINVVVRTRKVVGVVAGIAVVGLVVVLCFVAVMGHVFGSTDHRSSLLNTEQLTLALNSIELLSNSQNQLLALNGSLSLNEGLNLSLNEGLLLNQGQLSSTSLPDNS